MANKQSHYNPLRALKSQEVFRVLEAWGLTSWSNLWNVVKYAARCIRSGKPVQDRVKARFYLERDIQLELARVIEELVIADTDKKYSQQEADNFVKLAAAIRHKLRPSTIVIDTIQKAMAAVHGDHEGIPGAAQEFFTTVLATHPDTAWILKSGRE